MKKTLLLMAVSLLGVVAVNAQVRKTWDFTQGVSETDRANLTADTQNWSTSGEDESAYWADKTKLYGTLQANGQDLEFVSHLYIGTNGLKTSNNFKIGPKAYRMNRAGMRTYLPKLVNGQMVTVMARSANSTAENRGLTGSSTLNYISGPTGGICLGSGVEGSEGTYTLVWEVSTESTDSVDCYLELVGGGVDIQSIIIDNGDEAEIEEDPNVAYVYTGDVESDAFRAYVGLDGYATVSNIDVAQLISGEVSTDSIETFDLVVLSKDAQEVEGAAAYLPARLNRVPILNLYPSAAFGYTLVDPNLAALTVAEDYLEDEVFADLEYSGDNDNELVFFNGETGVLGYTLDASSVFASDAVYATAGEANAMHVHGKKNAYMLLPIQPDQIIANEDLNLSDNGTALISNVVKYLAGTKSAVVAAAKPTITSVYANNQTTVTLASAISGAKIYYTIDGTDPTIASAVYSEPLVVTTDGMVIKAFVVVAGYNDSEIAESTINVYEQTSAPSLSVSYSEGYSTITMSAAEGVSVYYSFNDIEAVDDAALYTEPVVITEPATVYAFAAGDGVLQSDMATREVVVSGIPAVKDTVAHFTANEEDWFTNVTIYDYNMAAQEVPTENYAAKAAYYWGKSAWAYYSTTEVDSTYTVKDMNGADSTVTVYKADPAAMKYVYSSSDTQWRLASQGQVFTGETNVSPSYAIGNARSAYYAATAQDLIGEPSKGKMTFGGKGSGEPYSAKIESVVKFQAPFDVVSYVTNGGGKDFYLEIQVSADGENWTCLDSVKIADIQRNYAKTRLHYAGTDEVYVRMAQVGGSTKAQVYDIYVITTDGTTGIEAVESNDVKVADERIYDLMGRRVNAMTPGSIYLKNGKKVMVR